MLHTTIDTLAESGDPTDWMLALEQEYIRRFPEDSAPDPLRTRAGSREDAGQPVPGRDLGGSPG